MRAKCGLLRCCASLLWLGAVFFTPGVQALQDDLRDAGSGRFRAVLERLERNGAQSTADFHALCLAYLQTKRYAPLEACLTQLELRIQAGDKRTRLFRYEDATPTPWLMRAEMLLELQRPQESIAQAERAVQWLADDDTEDRALQIQALGILALARASARQTEAAQRTLRELAAVDTSYPFYHNHHSAKVLAQARGQMALGDYPAALALLRSDTAFAWRAMLSDLFSGAAARGDSLWLWQQLPREYMLLKCLLETGERENARKGMDALLQQAAIEDNGQIYWQLLADRGRIAEADGQLPQAIQYYQRAIDVLDAQRTSIATEANKIGFIADKEIVYIHLMQLHVQRGDTLAAFKVAERAKARALVDMLAAKNDLADAVPAGSAGQARQAFEELQQAEQAARVQEQEASPGEREQRRSRAVRAHLRLSETAPELAALVSVPAVAQQLDVPWIRQRLEPQEQLVEYYSHGRNGTIFVIERDSVRSFAYDAAAAEAEVRQLRALLAEQGSDSARLETLLQTLYARLIAPWLRSETRRLTLIPHGALHYLPFAALSDGQAALIDRAALSLLPSASVIEPLSRRQRSGATLPALVFGNPDLDNPALDLASAETEARQIAGMTPGAALHLRKEASEARFREMAPRAASIHLAMHGKFRADQPLQSGLYLARGDGQDGLLSVGELYTLNLPAQLVTLSACETGLGQVASGNDVIGLTRGFFYAGARYVVSSLWEVDDAATALLMQQFYALQKTGVALPEALRQAQREVRKTYPSPFFWAAFAVNG